MPPASRPARRRARRRRPGDDRDEQAHAHQRVEEAERVHDAFRQHRDGDGGERAGGRRARATVTTWRSMPRDRRTVVESCDSDVASMNRIASEALTSAENTADTVSPPSRFRRRPLG